MKAITAFVFLLALATAIVLVTPGYSYLPNYTASGSGPQMDRWDFAAFPVTWNLNPAIGSNITGSRSVAELEENIRMLQFPIPAGFWSGLKEQELLPKDVPVPATGRQTAV